MRFRKVPVQRPCEVPEGFGGEDAPTLLSWKALPAKFSKYFLQLLKSPFRHAKVTFGAIKSRRVYTEHQTSQALNFRFTSAH